MKLVIAAAAAAIAISASAGAADKKARPLRAAPALTAQVAAAQPPLSQIEATDIAAALHGAQPGSITVACAGAWCRALADGVAKEFSGAGWAVHRIDRGGLGIDGVSGIRLIYCGQEGRVVRDIIGSTPRYVEVAESATCSALLEREIYVVIGAPK